MPRQYVYPDDVKLPLIEEEVLEEWTRNDTFKKSLKLSEGRPHYTFYDGPPFATGLPHYGHILAGTIKDVVTRYAHQTGHHVERRFGWDTHGLPVEFEVDKTLGIKGPADVHKMGIANYNKECRAIVMRYATEWRITIERLGRWIDFDNDYKTLYPTFMESVWWVFSELVKKDLVYRGVKVMPFSTGCSTPLSNFEAGQNYKDVADPAAFVAFQLVENPNRRLVAWTTTPWTLPSNLALCVHPDLDYVAVKEPGSDVELVVLESAAKSLFKKGTKITTVEKFKGSTLKDKKYIPLFDYFKSQDVGQFYRVLNGTFVTTDQGTGVVHQAPYFGEIDYTTCLENGVITKNMKVVCPVDEKGLFTSEVTDYEGQYVKDADKKILKDLKDRGLLVKQEQVNHSYPYCWRSDTPLLYKAVPSWFINVQSFVPQLLKNNEQTFWVPSFVKDKRFANWLRDARDWAVSRNRFWGTPINLWVSEDFEEIVCPGSIAELEELTGEKITDLHRESIDHLTIPSRKGKGTLKRVSEVFDCWFESGSMPYASQHYPFEDRVKFEENFPADFIAEGIDQTRGWFYTLLVLSTALFDKPPFKNLICNGLILAGDGAKMSKSKKNYPDPLEVVGKHGADALRLYLINSPAVRGDNLKFSEDGVKEVVKTVFLPWYNAYRFFLQGVRLYEDEHQTDFVINVDGIENTMDKWILSFTNSLVKFVRAEMNQYHLYAVVAPLMKYFEALTNAYIRLNRKRLTRKAVPGDDKGQADRKAGLSTLGHVLVIITRLMAPFTPFFCEFLWKNLKLVSETADESIHFAMIPEVETDLIDTDVERRVSAMRSVIDIVRVLREHKSITARYPLHEVVVVNRSQQFLDDVASLEEYIRLESNVKKVTVSSDKEKYGVLLKADPDFKLIGKRLGGNSKVVGAYLRNKVTQAELEEVLDKGTVNIEGHDVTAEEVRVVYTVDPARLTQKGHWEPKADSQSVVLLNTEVDDDLLKEGLAREIVARVQGLRKDAGMFPLTPATAYVTFVTPNSTLAEVLNSNLQSVESLTNTKLVLGLPEGAKVKHSNKSNVKEDELELAFLEV
uniref:Isoleucine--tRNA ligase, cytoplasmic n=1 Tax=Panagrellus redivivus TaxID=6233 RepID=A0A7E4W0U0_PANRE